MIDEKNTCHAMTIAEEFVNATSDFMLDPANGGASPGSGVATPAPLRS